MGNARKLAWVLLAALLAGSGWYQPRARPAGPGLGPQGRATTDLQSPRPAQPRGGPISREMVPVVVATRDVPLGEPLAAGDLAVVHQLACLSSEGTYVDPEPLIGQIPLARLLAWEPVREARLARGLLPVGMEPVTVPVSEASSQPGFIAPGTFVDVLVAVPGHVDEAVTLLEAVTVLGVSPVRQQVSLALPGVAAERLRAAAWSGRVTLALRNDIDVTRIDHHGPPVTPTCAPRAITD